MKIGAFASFFAPMAAPQAIAEIAREMDRAGLDSLWFGEHVLLFDEMEFPYPGSADGRLPVPEGNGVPDQAATIAYLAGQTEHLRFGTGISLIPQRNPVYTAKEFATLDWLSGGRIDLGVGVGWCKEEVVSCGYDWHDRGARCDEALELMIKLWTEPVTNHQGKHFDVSGARFDPKPSQAPHVPLIVGGYSDAALARAAKYGQGWLGFGLTPEMAEPMLARLQASLDAAGRQRADFDIVMMPGDDSQDAARAFAEMGVDRLVPLIGVGTTNENLARIDYLNELAGLS